jgi:DNA-binding NarL/FixJ family response regulator
MFNSIPVIMFSTSSYPEDVEKASQLGAVSFFCKPTRLSDLKNSLSLVTKHLHAGTIQLVNQESDLFQTV